MTAPTVRPDRLAADTAMGPVTLDVADLAGMTAFYRDVITLQVLSEVTFRSMRKGYFEAGLMLNNIISSPFSGVGVGAFYRYGPYALRNSRDNLRIKLTVSLLF